MDDSGELIHASLDWASEMGRVSGRISGVKKTCAKRGKERRDREKGGQ
jgi:hypothetical protein